MNNSDDFEIPVTKENYRRIKQLFYKRIFFSRFGALLFVVIAFSGCINLLAYLMLGKWSFPKMIPIAIVGYIIFAFLLPIVAVDLNYKRALKDSRYRFKRQSWLKNF